jgi:hypothetical protein
MASKLEKAMQLADTRATYYLVQSLELDAEQILDCVFKVADEYQVADEYALYVVYQQYHYQGTGTPLPFELVQYLGDKTNKPSTVLFTSKKPTGRQIDEIKSLGGKYNRYLKWMGVPRNGWVFSITKFNEVARMVLDWDL